MAKLNKLLNGDKSLLQDLTPDWQQIGMHTGILEAIDNFNSRWNCNLGVTNKLRWKPGIYKLIKETAINAAFPKFDRKPSSGFKWTQFSDWKVSRFRDDLSSIEMALVAARRQGETLCIHIEEAKERYYLFINDLMEDFPYNSYGYLTVGHTLEGKKYRHRGYSGSYFRLNSHHDENGDFQHTYDETPKV